MPYEQARRLLGTGKIIGGRSRPRRGAGGRDPGGGYLGLSPIFATGTKDDAGAPCGTAVIAELKKHCRVPVVAIGGIGLSNVDEVVAAGADMVCAISAVVTKPDVAAAILEFQRRYES
jgi:thiamine-phosphate pyrophosphorylase